MFSNTISIGIGINAKRVRPSGAPPFASTQWQLITAQWQTIVTNWN